MRKYLPLELGAVLGPIVFTVAWFVLGFVSPGYSLWGTRVAPYSAISQPLSGLGLGPTGPFMNAAFVLTGLLMIEGAFGIFQQQDELSRSARRLGAVLLVLPGLGAVIDGFFTFEHFLPHFVGFALALTTMVSFPIVGVMLRRTWDWRTVGTGLVIAGPLTLALAVLYFATFTPTVAGIQTGVAG
ncbi:MAG TPA: DUF998 domain-containing protein, partial [Candidatus Dormibacteraeota bacterium]|nr:DUF998 domain-containing protein [Candidatus Dormibacteraeota bacterium]